MVAGTGIATLYPLHMQLRLNDIFQVAGLLETVLCAMGARKRLMLPRDTYPHAIRHTRGTPIFGALLSPLRPGLLAAQLVVRFAQVLVAPPVVVNSLVGRNLQFRIEAVLCRLPEAACTTSHRPSSRWAGPNRSSSRVTSFRPVDKRSLMML